MVFVKWEMILMREFYDVSKAFDTINHEQLLNKHFNMRIKGHLYEWIHNYLHMVMLNESGSRVNQRHQCRTQYFGVSLVYSVYHCWCPCNDLCKLSISEIYTGWVSKMSYYCKENALKLINNKPKMVLIELGYYSQKG